MYNYSPMLKLLKSKNMTKSDPVNKLGISSKTISKISRNEKIRNDVLDKISSYLKCNTKDLYKEESNNNLLNVLREEKSIKLKGGIYHELQVRMTYNSNHIEGIDTLPHLKKWGILFCNQNSIMRHKFISPYTFIIYSLIFHKNHFGIAMTIQNYLYA